MRSKYMRAALYAAQRPPEESIATRISAGMKQAGLCEDGLGTPYQAMMTGRYYGELLQLRERGTPPEHWDGPFWDVMLEGSAEPEKEN